MCRMWLLWSLSHRYPGREQSIGLCVCVGVCVCVRETGDIKRMSTEVYQKFICCQISYSTKLLRGLIFAVFVGLAILYKNVSTKNC